MNLTKEWIHHMVTTMTVGERKSWIQDQGYQAWKNNNYRGTEEMATGTGKTRIGWRAAAEELTANPNAVVVIAVPTETMRDTDWPQEARDAGYEWVIDKVTLVCWASITKVKVPGKEIDLLILDEVHRITPANSTILSDNKVYKILGLTATLPGTTYENDIDKHNIITHYCPSVFKITLEMAVEMQLVADFDIYVLKFDLNETDAYLQHPNKKITTKMTEKAMYDYLTKQLQRATYMKNNEGAKFVWIQRRTEFLYNLRSKELLARDVIDSIMKNNERTILFCGSIEQSEKLCGKQVYHSRTTDEQLVRFIDGEINYLGAVQSLNEGKNIPNMDQILVIQLNSKELNIIQRIGRTVRWRPGHKARVIILVAKKTADEKWYKTAVENMNRSRINEHYVKPVTKAA